MTAPFSLTSTDHKKAPSARESALVFDPFGGLFTVPLRAIAMERHGRAAELHHGYFLDGVKYLEAKERERAIPSFFDFLDAEDATAEPKAAAE